MITPHCESAYKSKQPLLMVPAHTGPHSVAAAQSLARTADWRHDDHSLFMGLSASETRGPQQQPVPLLPYLVSVLHFEMYCKCGNLLSPLVGAGLQPVVPNAAISISAPTASARGGRRWQSDRRGWLYAIRLYDIWLLTNCT